MRKQWTVTLRWAWQRPRYPSRHLPHFESRADLLRDNPYGDKPALHEDQVVDVWVRPVPRYPESDPADWEPIGTLEYLENTRTPILHIPMTMGHYT